MIRICYVIPSLGVGGTEKQLLYLVKDLVRDHEVTVICTRNEGALVGDARRAGAYVRALGLAGGWDPRMRWQLRKLFRSHRPDVVHSFMFGFDYAPNRAAHDAGTPVIVSSRRQIASWKKARHIWLQRRANAYVHRIVANSQAVADFAIAQEEADPALFTVIRNGISVNEYRSAADGAALRKRFKIPPYTRVIGIAANFSPVKDHRLFVESARALIAMRPDVHFLMVGNGPLARSIERLVARYDLTPRFTRIATIQEMADLYKIMDVCALTSKIEGAPNVIMEALAARTPVVAANVGGLPELIQDGVTGRLVEGRDPRKFAEIIAWILDHPDESAAMAERGAAFVECELSVEKMTQSYRALYAELLAQHPGRRA